jgi:hypothetical protein
LQHPHADLSAYIDRALAPAAQAAVEGHLAACGLCRAHVAQLRATVAFVQALPDPVPSRRLVPRLAAAPGPAWLAPLRTVMTFASGAAVFLFIASALVSNITFLAGGAATGASPASREASSDTAVTLQAPTAAQPGSTASQAGSPEKLVGAPVPSPNAALAQHSATPPSTAAADGRAMVTTDAKRSEEATTAPGSTAAPVAAAPGVQQGRGQFAASEPQPSPLLNPWLWLALAIISGGIAIALQRRLRASV